jgi:hypothetical protein
MSTFNHWYNEVADMPVKQNGVWVDLETGFSYSDWLSSDEQKPRFKPNDVTLKARNIAKFFGGKALTGTAKQKTWAEQIRAKVLGSVTEIQAETLCFLTMFTSAKFWIENRNMSASQMGENAEIAVELIKKINKLGREAESALVVDQSRTIIDDSKYKELMAERNLLIDKLESLFILK